MRHFGDDFVSGTAIFVMVAALWPGSLSTMSKALLLTHYEQMMQAKNKPLCFKSLKYGGVYYHSIAYPN